MFSATQTEALYPTPSFPEQTVDNDQSCAEGTEEEDGSTATVTTLEGGNGVIQEVCSLEMEGGEEAETGEEEEQEEEDIADDEEDLIDDEDEDEI